jgi:hypothetical protein
MKPNWFSRNRWFYFQMFVASRVLCLPAAIFCLTVFTAVDRHSHTVRYE